MNLDYFESFFTIVDEGSITKAAKKLHISQPALSAQINCLEKYFQVSLIERSTKGTKLTPAGEILYTEGKRFNNLFRSMCNKIRQYSEDGTDELYIGASSTIGNHAMPCTIFSFKERYPQYDIILEMGNSKKIIDMVVEDQVGLGLIEGPVDNDLRKELKVSGIHTKRMGSDQLVVAAPFQEPWVNRDFITVEELTQEQLVLREKSSGIRKTVEQVLSSHGLKTSQLNIPMELADNSAIMCAITNNKGLSILPQKAIKHEIMSESVKSLVVEGIDFHHPLTMIYHPNKLDDFLHREFFDMLVNEGFCFC